jgi:hypothetical protein
VTILDILRTFEGGEAVERLDDDVRDLAARVAATGKTGEITITVRLDKIGRLIEGSLKWKSKAPRPDVPTATFHVSDDGDLQAEDPKQLKLEISRRPSA